ncbi:Aldo/keto reductase [Patellaria atrata CBS 101060]|uniref:Aldo/keto reductase n=1 Tax=Patellaria atrata CBS 101060 TaxID=1346257 RepID=A0A9P4S928_9PEZI|nr:Aldo/keto reductase [Patellaria atrata CBS 101060]
MPLVVQRLKPRIILGCMTFGPDKEGGATVNLLDDYKKILDVFQSQGYNEIDTARTYVNGKQEAFTAAAGWKDRGLTIATKSYPSTPGIHKKEVITEQINTSLKELQTDTVDIFYLHAADRSVPFTETLEVVNEFHKEGKFVQLGLSNYTAFEVAEIVITCKERGWVRPTIYQAMYNAITRSIEPELIPACRRYGLEIVIYNPLAGGIFSGKYKVNQAPSEGRFSDSLGALGKRYRDRYFRDSTFAALEIIEPVVKKNGLTLLETAFRWVMHHSALNVKDGNDGIIIGVSSLAQLEGNLNDLEKGPLPEEVVKALDDAWLINKATAPPYWHLELKYTYDTRKELFGLGG